MLQTIEELNRRVWGDKVTLATTAHLVGGVGLGLLATCSMAEKARPLAFTLIGLSVLAHLYAIATSTGVWLGPCV